MEQNYSKILKYKNIKEPARDILRYIDNRRKGVEYSLRTRWPKFNKACMGGIEPRTIMTILGISGGGKSSMANSLETDLFDLNPNIDFVVLSFTFEMTSDRQIGRKLSARLQRTTSELYSGDQDNKVTDEEYTNIVQTTKDLVNYPIYYVDTPGTVEEIKNTILAFAEEDFAKGKWIVVFLDHVLLTQGKDGESERKVIAELEKVLIYLKKTMHKTTIIQLSQMNRDIESSERINNKALHYPQRSDIFGSDSIFQASDIVICLHRPDKLGILEYGIHSLPTKDLVFLHLIKQREGKEGIIVFTNNLKYNTLDEYVPKKESDN